MTEAHKRAMILRIASGDTNVQIRDYFQRHFEVEVTASAIAAWRSNPQVRQVIEAHRLESMDSGLANRSKRVELLDRMADAQTRDLFIEREDGSLALRAGNGGMALDRKATADLIGQLRETVGAIGKLVDEKESVKIELSGTVTHEHAMKLGLGSLSTEELQAVVTESAESIEAEYREEDESGEGGTEAFSMFSFENVGPVRDMDQEESDEAPWEV
jgi:hypothetical protein